MKFTSQQSLYSQALKSFPQHFNTTATLPFYLLHHTYYYSPFLKKSGMGEIIYFIELIFWHVCCSSVLWHYSIWRHLYFYASKTISNSYCVQRSRIDFLRVGSYFFIKHKPKENKIKVLADKKNKQCPDKSKYILVVCFTITVIFF